MMMRSTLSFVVQEHHEGGVCHWDLMLHRPMEAAGPDDRVLATWKLDVQPAGENLNQPIPARTLPDHRRAYLSYEGPIHSGERGWCKIVDWGVFDLRDHTADLWRVVLHGQHLRGEFILKKLGKPGAWVLAKAEPMG